jgi:hypothetical protein
MAQPRARDRRGDAGAARHRAAAVFKFFRAASEGRPCTSCHRTGRPCSSRSTSAARR